MPDSLISLHQQSSLAVLQPLDQPVLRNHMDLSGIPSLYRMLLGILSGEDGVACALQCIQTHAPTLPPLFMPGVMCLCRVMATLCYLGPDVNVALSSAHHLVRFPLIWRVHGVVMGWEGYHEERSNSTPRQAYGCSAQSQSPTSQGLSPYTDLLYWCPMLCSDVSLDPLKAQPQTSPTKGVETEAPLPAYL